MSRAQSVDAVRLFVKGMMSIFRHVVLWCLFSSIFSFAALAELKCSDGSDPVEHKNCTFGKCGVCPIIDGGSSWASPKVEVVYRPQEYYGAVDNYATNTYRAVINAAKCSWLYGTRFCVRTAKPAVPANGLVPASPAEQGNDTNRPRLCAYEDPCDTMDPPSGNCSTNAENSPYHKNSRHKRGVTEQTFNTMVTTVVGCVDRPIGPLPQMWKNSAWFDNSDFPPAFVEASSSVFESPKIQMQNCRTTPVEGASLSSSPKVSCTNFDATTMTVEPLYVLNPNNSNNYIDCADAEGNHITTPTSVSSTLKVYCAFVSKIIPDKVQVRMIAPGENVTANTADGNAGSFVTLLSRPGYMPKPTIEQASNSTSTEPKIKVTLRGADITLEDDPGYYDSSPLTPQASPVWEPTKICKHLHQVQFCIGRPCKVGQMVTTYDSGVYKQECLEYEKKVCIGGYEKSSPYTVVNITNSTTLANSTADQPIAVFPNVSVLSNTDYLNTAAKKENGSYLTERFSKNLLVMKEGMPAQCYKRSSDSPTAYCQNYNGSCDVGTPPNCSTYTIENTSQAADIWYINPEAYQTRHLNAYESGLCLFTPPDSKELTFTATGANQTYTVPTNCTQLTVDIWGGGAAGSFVSGCTTYCDWAGGAGGHAQGVIAVSGGQTYSLYVGSGGSSAKGKAGQESWFASSTKIYANGGGNPADVNFGYLGGSAGYDSTVLSPVQHQGQSGGAATCATVQGGNPYNGSGQASSSCATSGSAKGPASISAGAGGCASDDSCGNSAWGIGSPGKVIVRCSQGMD